MSQYLFKNFRLLEPSFDEIRDGYELLVEGTTIREVADKPIKSALANVIDCGGRTLMPGLIDSHVHVFLSEVYIPNLEKIPLTLMTARSIGLMKGMIDRGFTSVRDTGGADWGIKKRSRRAILRHHVYSSRVRRLGPPVVIPIHDAELITVCAVTAATQCLSRCASPMVLRKFVVPHANRCAKGQIMSRS